MKQQRISGKEAARVAEDMAKPGPIRVVAASEAQEAPGALVPSPGSELDRKAPPRVRKPLPRNDQWKAPTPDLEGHRKRLREALGNTLSDEFVDVILGKLVEALRPGLYDQLEEATLNAAHDRQEVQSADTLFLSAGAAAAALGGAWPSKAGELPIEPWR